MNMILMVCPFLHFNARPYEAMLKNTEREGILCSRLHTHIM